MTVKNVYKPKILRETYTGSNSKINRKKAMADFNVCSVTTHIK